MHSCVPGDDKIDLEEFIALCGGESVFTANAARFQQTSGAKRGHQIPGAVKMPNVWLGAYLLSREGAARLLAALQEARYTGNEHIDWALSRDVLLRPDVRAFVAAQTNHFSVKVDGDDARKQLDREGPQSYGSKRLRSRR